MFTWTTELTSLRQLYWYRVVSSLEYIVGNEIPLNYGNGGILNTTDYQHEEYEPKKGGMPSVEGFLRDLNTYLSEIRKIPLNSLILIHKNIKRKEKF